MKNKFSCFLTPKGRWLTATLFLLFSLGIGNAWGTSTYKMIENNAFNSNHFWTTAGITEDAKTIQGESCSHKLNISSAVRGWSSCTYNDRMVKYDQKTNSTTFEVYYNHTNTSTHHIYAVQVIEGGATTTKSKEIKTNALDSAHFTFASAENKKATVYFYFDNTKVSIYQIKATENGTEIPNRIAGKIGYSIDFDKARFILRSATEHRVDSCLILKGNNSCYPGNATYAQIKTKGTEYIQVYVSAACEMIVKTVAANVKFDVIASVPSSDGTYTKYTSKANDTIQVPVTAGTWYITPNGSNVQVSGIAFETDAAPSAAPSITAQPATAAANYEQDAAATALSVTATGSGTLTYQWYKNTTNSNASGTAIDGATSASYTPSTAEVGTLYYYCAVTNTESGKSATTVKSNVSGAISVILNPVGSGHVLTWNLTVRESSSGESTLGTATTDIGTASKNSTSTYITNLTDLTGVGVKRTTDGKSNNTGKIETPASYDADKYVSYSFDVASGYTFTPSAVSIKTVAVSTAKDLKFEFNDANGSYSVTKTNLSTSGTAATNNLDFSECDVNFTGTVTVKMYVYGATNAYRLSTPLTITGTVAAKPTATAPSISAPTADSEAEYDLGSTITALEVTATGYPAPTYQWYKNATKTTEGATAIDGAESASYTPANNAASDFYYYCVATNASGSATSHFFHVTVNSCAKPGTPANLAAGSITYNSAALSWSAAANSDGYKVYVEKKSDKSKILDWTTCATNSYAATGLAQGTEYTFKVKAVGATGYCEFSDEASADFTTGAPSIADLVEISDDWTFTPSATIAAGALAEGSKLFASGANDCDISDGKMRIKENRALAFKVKSGAKVKVTFTTNSNLEMKLGTAMTGDDSQVYGHSKTSPVTFNVTADGVVYLTATEQLYMSKMEIVYPHSVTYALNGGDGTLPTESAHYVGDKFNLHNGEDGITAPTDKEFAGWNDGSTTYVGGAEYTMGASAVMLTAQWATPLPAPTITFNAGNYTIAGAALDLSTLFSSNSDGAVTYTVKTAGETGAAIDGTSFTATAAGSAVVTASQAATASYKAKSVDATITISAPSEVDGIKLVVDGDLTGNFRTSQSLTTLSGDNKYTIAGLNYTKYIKFGSSVSSWSAVSGPSNKYLAYTPTKKTTNFYFYVHNNSSSVSYINLYLIEEGNVTPSKVQVEVAGNANVLKTYELNITKNTEVYITAESNNVYYCQVVAVESGDALPQAPAVGYEMNLNKGRLSTASATATTLDGLTFVLGSGYSIASSTVATIGTNGTHYVSFTIPDGQTRQLQLTTSNTNKYTVSKTLGDDENQFTPTANEAKNWNLTPGTWYINPQGSNVQITNIAFAAAPTSYTVTFDADGGSSVDDQIVFEGGKATEPTAPTKSSYDFIGWYNGADLYDFDGVVSTNLTLTAHWTVHVTNDATLKSLKYGEQSIALEDGVYEYNVELPYYTVGVPELTAVTNSADAKTPVITNAAALDANNQATSTVSVTSEDESVTLLYQVHFTKVVLYEWQEVSGSINWDFANAALAQIKLVDNGTPVAKDEEAVMANIPGTTNNATFNSQALKFKGEYIHRSDDGTNYPSCATTIKFKTTVPGVVTVRYADNGGNNRCLSINGHLGAASSSKTDYKTYSVCVPAGEVVLTGHKGSEDDKYIRFFEIDFKAASELNPANADESTLGGSERPVTEGRYGTICLPKAGVMVGAAIYELAYYSDSENKIFMDQVINGEMIAGRPYIFLPNESVSTLGVYYTDDEVVAAGDYRGLYGFYDNSGEPMQLDPGDGHYILFNNQFREVTDSYVYIDQNRAYFKIGVSGGIPTTPSAPLPNRRRVVMSGYSTNSATGMENAEASEAPVKMMIDGQLFILRGEKLYDATGRLVK